MFNDLWAALALMLIFEGMMPFLNPELWRKLLRSALELDNRQLHWFGFFIMATGLLLLYLVRY
ncbi:DUF2065 domain-containing protein [Candidatus Venteria ishoeyi]|uniref:DUF2065 domain-containing protein n=1 Tax=Candidatus Venteria ishoeyi TaxID=1899563 RepID=A0A1H6FDU2_9GAMM|nr:DUF2065 domain-containing protein [Candidatus Venteria ishoeyi]MDM8547102.1 DUF2065 domain-containing protein [Candidatus Venteria ishoeyi]SEH08250.1 Uncharacterised protein [Candidatus Venteria ishoeyi]